MSMMYLSLSLDFSTLPLPAECDLRREKCSVDIIWNSCLVFKLNDLFNFIAIHFLMGKVGECHIIVVHIKLCSLKVTICLTEKDVLCLYFCFIWKCCDFLRSWIQSRYFFCVGNVYKKTKTLHWTLVVGSKSKYCLGFI